MRPSVLLLPALALISGAAAQAVDAWHLDTLYTLATERLDPIVNPNGVSSHLHRILGGSQFGANYNYDQYDGASCSSAAVQADKSNYWMPQLFWMENNTYTPLNVGTRFYYFLARNNLTTPVQAFPKGLRMLIGNPNAKTYADTGLPTAAAGFICLNQHFATPTLDKAGPDFNFATDCPMGLTTTIKFPPCWDGVNLYKSDGSHMSYTDNIQYGSCPYSHPVRLPGIMLEYVWQTENLRPGVPLAGHLTWANGDTTGYGIHADFVNGWDVDVLNQALNDPNCVGKGEMTMTGCPVLAAHMNSAAASTCKPQRGVLETYTDNVPLNALPGCNIPWSSGPKPTCSPAVTNPSVPSALTGTDGSLTYDGSGATVLPTTANVWTRMGCIGGQATLQNSFQYTDAALTVEKCNAFCAEWGMPYSAVLSGSYCQCGSGFDPSAFVYPDTSCSTKCSGAANETCGGNGKLEIYHNPSSTVINHNVAASSDPQYIGCRHDGVNGRALNGSYISYGQMTVEWCKNQCAAQGFSLAAIEFGHACMCGNSWAFNGGTPMPANQCMVPCGANSNEMCGGPGNTISAYNLTIAGGMKVSSSANVQSTSIIATSSVTSAKSSTETASSSVGPTTSPTSVAVSVSGAVTVTKTVTLTAACATSTAANKARHLARRFRQVF